MDKKVSSHYGDIKLEIMALYLSDYRIRLHVRGISRLLTANHRTVSLALKKLEDKGVMKHESVGKSKQYFLNLDNLTTKEYLKNAESLNTIKILEKHFIIKKLLTELVSEIKNVPLVLFGSYASGKEKKGSDVDLLVMKYGSKKEMKGIINKIEGFSSRHNIVMQIQKTTLKQFETGIREKDNLVVEIIRNHVVLNNTEVLVDMLWRHYNEG